MKKITLAQALKLKNKLVHQKINFQNLIKTDNSALADNDFVKREELIIEYCKKHKIITDKLIDLKTKIAIANNPIIDKIFTLAELKGYILWYNEFNTKNGYCLSSDYGDGTKNKYYAIFDKNAIREKIEQVPFIN